MVPTKVGEKMWWTKSTPNHEFQACPDHSILAPTDAHWLVLALLLLLWRAPELFQSRETHLHSSFIAIHVKGGFSHSARSCHQIMRSCSRFTDITKVWIICLLRTLGDWACELFAFHYSMVVRSTIACDVRSTLRENDGA